MVSTLLEQKGEKPVKSAGKRKPSAPETPFLGPRLDSVPGDGPRLAGKLPPDQFFALVEAYPNKEMLVFYLYRQWPIINRKQADPNNPKNVAKYTYEGGDLRKLIHREFGSGEYGLKVVDPTKPNGQQRLAQTEWTFNDPDLPPQLDVDELVLGHPRNRSYEDGLRRIGQLKGEVEEMADTATEQLGTIAQKALHELAEARKKPEPVAAGDAPLMGIVQMMFQQQMAQMQQQSAMMLEFFKAKQAAPAPAAAPVSSVADQLALFREVKEIIDDMGGGAVAAVNPGKMSTWQHVLAALGPSLPQLLGFLSRVASSPVTAPGPVAPVMAAPAAVPVPPATPVDPLPVAQPAGDDMQLQIGLRLVAVAQKAIKALDGGMSGDAFAENLCVLEDDGEQVYSWLTAMGLDGIMQTLGSLPQWPALEPRRADVEQFVKDFLSYGVDDDAPGGAVLQ